MSNLMELQLEVVMQKSVGHFKGIFFFAWYWSQLVLLVKLLQQPEDDADIMCNTATAESLSWLRSLV